MSTVLIVKQLREKTGARISDCAEAVKACDGDFEKAVSWLQSKNMDRGALNDKAAGEGRINIVVGTEGWEESAFSTFLVEFSSATDFAAKNDDFKKMLYLVSKHAAIRNCKSLEELEQATFFNSTTVADSIKALAGTLGEPIKIKKFLRVDGPAGFYLHSDEKQAAIVEVSGVDDKDARDIGKDLSMHVCFAKPEYLSVDDVPFVVVTKEMGRINDQIKNDERMRGKPDNILSKIAKGQLDKFNSKVCLLEQPHYKENKKKVSQVLTEKNPLAKVKAYYRFMVGQ